MLRGTKGLTVVFHVVWQFWEGIDWRRNEDCIPAFTGKSRSFWAIIRNTQWRMRFLQRLRSHRGRRNTKMFALECTSVLCPRLFDNCQRFLKPFTTLIA